MSDEKSPLDYLLADLAIYGNFYLVQTSTGIERIDPAKVMLVERDEPIEFKFRGLETS